MRFNQNTRQRPACPLLFLLLQASLILTLFLSLFLSSTQIEMKSPFIIGITFSIVSFWTLSLLLSDRGSERPRRVDVQRDCWSHLFHRSTGRPLGPQCR